MNPQETIDQLGGRGLSGALVYCGTRSIQFDRPGRKMYFTVNGRRGFKTCIIVKLDANDTYTVELISYRGTNTPAVYDRKHDVYCDELQSVFEGMYDNHMQTMNKGFIPIS